MFNGSLPALSRVSRPTGKSPNGAQWSMRWWRSLLLARRLKSWRHRLRFIRARVEANSSRWVPRWLDGIVADKIVTTIVATLAEMRDPAHPMGERKTRGVTEAVRRPGHSTSATMASD